MVSHPLLTPAQERLRVVLYDHGLRNNRASILAAAKVGLPLPVACALVNKESADPSRSIVGGANIYGHDVGGMFSHAVSLKVTKKNFAQFYDAVVNHGHTSNGVGPCQITYPGYFPQMQAKGLKPWRALDSMTFGYAILKGNHDRTRSWEAAGGLYNGGSNWEKVSTAVEYGHDLVAKIQHWQQVLG